MWEDLSVLYQSKLKTRDVNIKSEQVEKEMKWDIACVISLQKEEAEEEENILLSQSHSSMRSLPSCLHHYYSPVPTSVPGFS